MVYYELVVLGGFKLFGRMKILFYFLIKGKGLAVLQFKT